METKPSSFKSSPHPDPSISTEPEPTYGVTSYRFVIVILYVIATNHNMLAWGVFVPLQSTLESVYNQGLTYINFATVITSYVTYMVGTPPINYLLDRYGLKMGIILGSLITVIGLWIRCLSEDSFTWIFVGQCVLGVAQPFFLATPQKFSNVWFSPDERQYSTGFMTITQNIGTILGPLVSQWFVNTNADNATILVQIYNMMFYTALAATVCFIITIPLMKEAPLIPPSKAALAVKYDIKTSVQKLIRNRNAMVMITSTSMVNAVLWSYVGVFQQLVMPFGVNSNAAGTIISISTAIGLFGLIFGAVILQKSSRYNLVINSTTSIAWIAIVLSYFAVEAGSTVGFCICLTVVQFIYAPVNPAALEYGVELAFPVEEATIGSCWYLINQVMTIIGTFVGDFIIGNTPNLTTSRITFGLYIACYFIFMIPNFFVKQDLRRMHYELNNQLLEEGQEVKKLGIHNDETRTEVGL